MVSFHYGDSAECSPLSCNRLATVVETNSNCLLATLEQAKQLLDVGVFTGSERGPFRVFAVSSVRGTTTAAVPLSELRVAKPFSPGSEYPGVIGGYEICRVALARRLPCSTTAAASGRVLG